MPYGSEGYLARAQMLMQGIPYGWGHSLGRGIERAADNIGDAYDEAYRRRKYEEESLARERLERDAMQFRDMAFDRQGQWRDEDLARAADEIARQESARLAGMGAVNDPRLRPGDDKIAALMRARMEEERLDRGRRNDLLDRLGQLDLRLKEQAAGNVMTPQQEADLEVDTAGRKEAARVAAALKAQREAKLAGMNPIQRFLAEKLGIEPRPPEEIPAGVALLREQIRALEAAGLDPNEARRRAILGNEGGTPAGVQTLDAKARMLVEAGMSPEEAKRAAVLGAQAGGDDWIPKFARDLASRQAEALALKREDDTNTSDVDESQLGVDPVKFAALVKQQEDALRAAFGSPAPAGGGSPAGGEIPFFLRDFAPRGGGGFPPVAPGLPQSLPPDVAAPRSPAPPSPDGSSAVGSGDRPRTPPAGGGTMGGAKPAGPKSPAYDSTALWAQAERGGGEGMSPDQVNALLLDAKQNPDPRKFQILRKLGVIR